MWRRSLEFLLVGWMGKTSAGGTLIKKGEYTVKSGYKSEILKRFAIRGTCSSQLADWWSRSWKLRIPSEVAIFVSKSWFECLPSRIGLCKHGMEICPWCLCKYKEELVSHALFWCSRVKQNWYVVFPRRWPDLSKMIQRLDIWRVVIKNFNDSDLATACITTWAI